MSVWLSPAELHRLTGKKRYTAQRRVLTERKIPFRCAASGEPLVRADWDRVDATGKPAHRQHRWDRLASVRNLPARS